MQWNLEYARRLFGTALSFAVFGIGGLFYGLVMFPLMFLFTRDRARRRVVARRLIGKGFGAFAGFMKAVGVVDYRIEGREHIDDQRRQLIIANHPTLIDVVLLISLFPQANCVIKEAVRRNPFMRSTVRAADYISNNGPEELLEACVNCLANGNSLLLFPEGTRTGHEGPINFKMGAAAVALRADVDVLPVAIQCEPLFLSRQVPWHYIPRAKPMFTIRIMPPRPANSVVSDVADERLKRHELNDALRELIVAELDDMAFSKK